MIHLPFRKRLRLSFGDQVTVPSWRGDVVGMADLAEEVARFHGYNKIPSTLVRGETTRGGYSPEQKLEQTLGSVCRACGYDEIITYSFISPTYYDKILWPADYHARKSFKILNPLGEDTSIMRTTTLPSMLEILTRNYNFRNKSAKLYEVGRIYLPKSGSTPVSPDAPALAASKEKLENMGVNGLTEALTGALNQMNQDDGLANEAKVLSMGAYGEDMDFFTLKGVLENLFAAFGVQADYAVAAEPYLHPGRQASARSGDTVLATLGEMHPDVAAKYGLDERVYVAEVELRALFAAAGGPIVYKPLPRFPAVERDLALLCDDDLPVAEIEKAIRSAGGRYLESVQLFDVYRGAQITAGKKSVAYSLMFRSPEGTLTDAEIEPALKKIFKSLHEKGCILRS